MLNATISQVFDKYLLKEQISKWWDEWKNLLQCWQMKNSCVIVHHKVNLWIKSNTVFFVLSHNGISVCWEIVPSVPVHTPKKDKWKQCFLFLPLSYFWPQKLSPWSINIVDFFLQSKWQDGYFWNKFYLFVTGTMND